MTKITVIIPTFNEESNVQRALDSVFFADEIIVIDAFSTDKTVTIVKQNNVKLIQRVFDDFSSQKNYAISQAKNDWILIVDADEELSEELKNSIRSTLSKKSNNKAYRMRRKNFVRHKKLHFGGFTNKIIRLFHREYAHYQGLVHERVKVTGEIGNLSGVINHYTYKDYQQFKDKINHYAKLRAVELFKKGKKVSFFHLYIKPAARFCIHYILKLGFLDGKNGAIFSYLMAYGVSQRFNELILLKKEQNENRI